MFTKKETALTRRSGPHDAFAMLRQMTSELDRMFEGFELPAFQWPSLRSRPALEAASWFPEIDVFEKDNRLVTKVDLPGMKKEDVKVEVADGRLTISGERQTEAEEKKKDFYRSERQYGSFYRSVPLPEDAKLEDVKATFSDGVLEVSVPLPATPAAKARTVQIQDAAAAKAAKPAA
jgi:HSP20 family protein